VQSEVAKNQREYFLREQLKAIQRSSRGHEHAREIGELRERMEAAGMPDPVKREALRELDRLARCRGGGGVHVSRTYLDWLIALPWRSAPTRSSI